MLTSSVTIGNSAIKIDSVQVEIYEIVSERERILIGQYIVNFDYSIALKRGKTYKIQLKRADYQDIAFGIDTRFQSQHIFLFMDFFMYHD